MRDLLAKAGFEVKSINEHGSVREYASPEALIRYSEASSFGNLLAHLPVELRPAARKAISRAAAPLIGPDGTIRQEGQRMVVIAVRR